MGYGLWFLRKIRLTQLCVELSWVWQLILLIDLNSKWEDGRGGGGGGLALFFWHNSSSWVEVRLHAENQLPRYTGSDFKSDGRFLAAQAIRIVVWFIIGK